MKGRRISLLAGALLMCLSIQTFAVSKTGRSATRIKFRRGESSATVIGKLTSRRLKQSFVVGAESGQELSVQVSAREGNEPSFANFIVSDPFGKSVGADDAGRARIRLKHTGDYKIELTPPGMFYRTTGYMELQFTLSVRLE